MKTLRRSLLFSALALLGASSFAFASMPTMQVTVSKASGKVVYKGKTTAEGMFTTNKLPAGSYVVQFNALGSAKGGPYALVVAAGKKKVVADSVSTTKFNQGGVAIKVEVNEPMSLVGKIGAAGDTELASNEPAKGTGNAKVKYVNGKKFIWVTGGLGSNLGGHWVDANSPEARRVETLTKEQVSEIQSHAGVPGGGGG